MWMMYVGINGINSKTFLQFLYKADPGVDLTKLMLSSSIQSDKLKCLHLFQCFMEAKSETVPKEISSIFHYNEINFHSLQLLPYHVSSLILYISKYSIQLKSLNLRDCHIGDIGMSMLEHYFSVNPDKASSIKHIDLFGNNSVLLWNVHCVIFGQQNLKTLNWSSLGGVNIDEIVNVMDNNTTVQSLDLSGNRFNDNDAEKIIHCLCKNNTLQELDFSNNNITTKGAILIISDFLQNGVKLRMSWNNRFIDTGNSSFDYARKGIKDGDARIVANILCKNDTVTKLNLSRNKITDTGASKCIKYNKSLKEIDVSKNNISNIGLTEMASAIKSNKALQSLNVSFNSISDVGAIAISECVKDNNVLQALNLSHNGISDDGAVAISECLKGNNTLQEFNMSHNKMSDKGIINIGKALKINATLQIIDISYNSISNVGVIKFSDHLKKRKQLKELRISLNNNACLIFDDMVQSCNMYNRKLRDAGVYLISAFLHSNINMKELNYFMQ